MNSSVNQNTLRRRSEFAWKHIQNSPLTVVGVWDPANMASPVPKPADNPTKTRKKAKIVGLILGDTGVEA